VIQWDDILLQPGDSISKAIDYLGKNCLRIVLIVDSKRRLLGTVTDGDIRRALISKKTLKSPVGEFMCTSPLVGKKTDKKSKLLSLMRSKDLLHIPILDKNKVVIGLQTLQSVTGGKRYDNLVFLMAGGFGKRLHPLTLDTPKPLLEIGNKPILENIIERFFEAGFSNFVISTHYKAEMLKNHFGDGSKLGVNIDYVYENSPLGTAGALGLLPERMVTSLPMVLMNGDLLTKVDFEEVLKFHNEEGGSATMCVREYDLQVPYGVVEVQGSRLENIFEKPTHKFFINAGIYVLDMKLLAGIKQGDHLDMPEFLQSHVTNGHKVNAFMIHEFWLDIGRIEDFQRAQVEVGRGFT